MADFDVQELYKVLAGLPRGRVISYGRLGQKLGNKAWARAIGNALHRNPDGDAVPCYKVLHADGTLSPAYRFGGMEEQKRRLEAEGIPVENGRVDMKIYGL